MGYAGSILDLDVVENSEGNATAFVLIVGSRSGGGRKEREGNGEYGRALVLSKSRSALKE